jgi:Na+-transporting methylmalonyl-CoA/oxaloacetate decarboxylase gamma subunit
MSPIATALWITLIGMGLVFASIILLWVLMDVLVRVVKDPAEPVEPRTEPALPAAETAPPDASCELELKQRAAATAVSLALAQLASSTEPHEFPLPPTAVVSPWQGVNRTKMLSKRGPVR